MNAKVIETLALQIVDTAKDIRSEPEPIAVSEGKENVGLGLNIEMKDESEKRVEIVEQEKENPKGDVQKQKATLPILAPASAIATPLFNDQLPSARELGKRRGIYMVTDVHFIPPASPKVDVVTSFHPLLPLMWLLIIRISRM